MDSRRLLLANGVTLSEGGVIYYTSSDGKIAEPYKTNVFGANIISNTYADGRGVITFDGDVTSIGENAFYKRTSLTSVTIPDGVTTIGNCAFQYCSRLKSITIPDSVTSIGSVAFDSCDSLTSVTIPNSVKTIRDYAFYNCSKLTSVYCKATTPPALGSYVFNVNGRGRKIYVPAESVEAYKSATNWSEYASAIVGYNF